MTEYFAKLNRLIELAEAAAVVQYIMAPDHRQDILRAKYIHILKSSEGFSHSEDYSDEERNNTRLVTSGLTLDQMLDDPRRGQGGKN